MGRNGSTAPLIRQIAQKLRASARDLSEDARRIVGIWDVEYAVRLRSGSSPLHLRHVCVETANIGSCYYERNEQPPPVGESDLGRDVVSGVWSNNPIRIAAYDAAFGSLVSEPTESRTLTGSAAEMALARAKVVTGEVRTLIEVVRAAHSKSNESDVRVVNVGVVGDFLELLSEDADLDLYATDFYPGVVNETIHDVTVEHGSKTLERVEQCDIALVTGMTLATNTLDELLATARQHNTAVVLFAETGSNFADIYLENGVRTVISEPFPFYLSGAGHCVANIYRGSHSRSIDR